AYNEGKVIAETLRALLETDYKGQIEVLVVNDGSGDETAAEIERISQIDRRVRLLEQDNHGKALALQRALSAVRHAVVGFVDAESSMCRTRSGGRKRRKLCARWPGSVSAGPTVPCNVCGNIATWFSTGTTARSAGLVCRASGFFKSCSSP